MKPKNYMKIYHFQIDNIKNDNSQILKEENTSIIKNENNLYNKAII